MIKTGLLVPSNYYTRSRDFQLIGRAMDCVFNSSKLYSDMVLYDTICKNTDTRLLDLVSKTAGFDVKRKYDVKDLYTLCSVFESILKKKGTKSAVEDCVRVLLKAQNINKDFSVDEVGATNLSGEKEYKIRILIPYELTDIALLEDMLDYVLPAGYLYNIVAVSQIKSGFDSVDASVKSAVSSDSYKSVELGNVFDHSKTTNLDPFKTELSVVYSPEDEEE